MVNGKMIIVKSRGYVNTSRGRVFAPITRPYREQPAIILRMITQDHADVYEVIPDIGEVKLTVTNFDRNNAEKIEITPPSIPKVSPVKTVVSTTPGNEHEVSDGLANVKHTNLLSNTPAQSPIDMGNPPDPVVAPKPGAFAKTNTSVLMEQPDEPEPTQTEVKEEVVDDTPTDTTEEVVEEQEEESVEEEATEEVKEEEPAPEQKQYPDNMQYQSGSRRNKKKHRNKNGNSDPTQPREVQ